LSVSLAPSPDPVGFFFSDSLADLPAAADVLLPLPEVFLTGFFVAFFLRSSSLDESSLDDELGSI
jgi:hypothetical protein